MKPSPKLPWIFVGLAALSAGLIAALLIRPQPLVLVSATALQTPRPVADFKLVNEQGQPADLGSLRGQWTLLFAGFTYCPDVCPTTLNLLNRVVEPLGAEAPLRVLLLSVDPDRDTPERLNKYLAQFNPRFSGLTGSEASIEQLQRGLGLLSVKVAGTGKDSYTVDHSSSLVLLNPQAEIVAYISPPFDATAITGDLRILMEKKT